MWSAEHDGHSARPQRGEVNAHACRKAYASSCETFVGSANPNKNWDASIIIRKIFYPFFSVALRHDFGSWLPITGLRDHTPGHTILDRNPMDERSDRRRHFYLTKHNTHKTQTFLPPEGFQPTFTASEQPQTHSLDCAFTGIGSFLMYVMNIPHTVPRVFIGMYLQVDRQKDGHGS